MVTTSMTRATLFCVLFILLAVACSLVDAQAWQWKCLTPGGDANKFSDYKPCDDAVFSTFCTTCGQKDTPDAAHLDIPTAHRPQCMTATSEAPDVPIIDPQGDEECPTPAPLPTCHCDLQCQRPTSETDGTIDWFPCTAAEYISLTASPSTCTTLKQTFADVTTRCVLPGKNDDGSARVVEAEIDANTQEAIPASHLTPCGVYNVQELSIVRDIAGSCAPQGEIMCTACEKAATNKCVFSGVLPQDGTTPVVVELDDAAQCATHPTVVNHQCPCSWGYKCLAADAVVGSTKASDYVDCSSTDIKPRHCTNMCGIIPSKASERVCAASRVDAKPKDTFEVAEIDASNTKCTAQSLPVPEINCECTALCQRTKDGQQHWVPCEESDWTTDDAVTSCSNNKYAASLVQNGKCFFKHDTTNAKYLDATDGTTLWVNNHGQTAVLSPLQRDGSAVQDCYAKREFVGTCHGVKKAGAAGCPSCGEPSWETCTFTTTPTNGQTAQQFQIPPTKCPNVASECPCAYDWLCPKNADATDAAYGSFANWISCTAIDHQKHICDTCQAIPQAQRNARCMATYPDENQQVQPAADVAKCTKKLPDYPCTCTQQCSLPGANAWGACTEQSGWEKATQCGAYDKRDVSLVPIVGPRIIPTTCNPTATTARAQKCKQEQFAARERLPTVQEVQQNCKVHAGCAAPMHQESTNAADYQECTATNRFPVCDHTTCAQGPSTRWKECVAQRPDGAAVMGLDLVQQFAQSADPKQQVFAPIVQALCQSELDRWDTVKPCYCKSELKCLPHGVAPTAAAYTTFTDCAQTDPTNGLLIGFNTCPTRVCEGELLVQQRQVYCRKSTGKWVVVNEETIEDSDCYHLSFPSASQECTGTTKCAAQWFCSKDLTKAWANGVAHNANDKCKNDASQFTDLCYTKTSQDNAFELNRCIIDGVTADPYRQRNVKCVLFEDEGDNKYPALADATNLIPPRFNNDLPAWCAYLANGRDFTAPSPITAALGTALNRKCEDVEGCAPQIDAFAPSATRINELQTLTLSWSFIGTTQSTAVVQIDFAYATQNDAKSEKLNWLPITTPTTQPRVTAKKFAWKIPHLDRTMTNHIYVRVAMTSGENTEAFYSEQIAINWVETCDTITCEGDNMSTPSCKMVSGVPTCQCIPPKYPRFNQIAYPGPRDAWGLCERNVLCDQHSTEVCKNGGYLKYDPTKEDERQCAETCTCPFGQKDATCTSCGEETCNLTRGVNTSPFKCTCESCLPGYTGAYCQHCTTEVHIEIERPAEALVAAFKQAQNANPNTIAAKLEYLKEFKSFVHQWLAVNYPFDPEMITFDEDKFIINAQGALENVIVFAGACKKSAPKRFMLQQQAVTADLPQNVHFLPFPQAFEQSRAFAIADSGNSRSTAVVVAATESGTATPISPPGAVNPTPSVDTPKKKKDHTTTIVVVVVVVGVVVIVGLGLLFWFFIKPKMTSGGGNTKADKPAKEKKEAAPKPAKPANPNDAHLELQ